MRKIKIFCGLVLLCISLWSCSEPTLQEDAQNAAFLTQQSMEYSLNNDLKSAESRYREAQKIIDKYSSTDRFREFMGTYDLFLQEYAETGGTTLR